MTVHDYDNEMRPDEDFIKGELSLLVPGNKCRLLDGRRTTGVIENYFEDSAMFRWKITKYEDKGKYWDLPAEDIERFQFEKDSKRLEHKRVRSIKEEVKKYDKVITIEAKEENKKKTEEIIRATKEQIKRWLKNNSQFLKEYEELDFNKQKGYESLYQDIVNYMEAEDLLEQEELTTKYFVLNPSSGEWIKGIKIMLAELGLVDYTGKVSRTNSIFKGKGSKLLRRKYIINRMAFLSALFELLDINELVLYRGMSTEQGWLEKDRTFLSCTFDPKVAEAFCCMERGSKYKNSYLVKLTVPIEKIFMTYLETKAMNNQYKEAEAIILFDKELKI